MIKTAQNATELTQGEHQLDADSERSAGGVVGSGTGGGGTNSNNQLPASPASLSVSPSVAALSTTTAPVHTTSTTTTTAMVTSTSAAVERGESNYLSQLTQQLRRTSIARTVANSFERARTIDQQEACSNGRPTDGSFEFSTKIKNSTSTELNE